jgi:hypothetical protein
VQQLAGIHELIWILELLGAGYRGTPRNGVNGVVGEIAASGGLKIILQMLFADFL